MVKRAPKNIINLYKNLIECLDEARIDYDREKLDGTFQT